VRVLFIQNNPLDESQALIDLAGFLKSHGHSSALLLDTAEKCLVDVARQASPHLVVVACSMLNHGWARSVAARLKDELGTPILMAGTAPTVYPKMLLDSEVDFIVRGEAELPVLAVLDALKSGVAADQVSEIAGLFRQAGGNWEGTPAGPPIEIGEIPTADKNIYYERYPFMRSFPFKRFLTSRGCYHNCTYCYIPSLNKVQGGRNKVRRKNPEQAVEEVALEASRGPLSHVHFSDDLFTNDPSWLDEFAALYRERVGIAFTCNTSAELVTNRVAKALAHAGCFAIGFAVETASEEVRNKVLRKGVTTDHVREAARQLHRHQVKITTFNMIALPGETPLQGLETARLNAEIGTHFVRLNYAFPMPGTGMCDYATENGYLSADWPEKFGQPSFRYSPGPQFETPHRKAFENLFILFRWAAGSTRAGSLVQRLLNAPTPRALHRLMTLQGAWNEKRAFRIPVASGLKFFAKVGRPELRATNFPALI
jgi:radical SAM superfamily enzyme YgiQ (UPF0313 family)